MEPLKSPLEEHIDKRSNIPTSSDVYGEFSTLISSPKNSLVEHRNYGGISSSDIENFASSSIFHCDESENASSPYQYPEEKLKIKLKYFFMNPLEKWRAKGKFPYKLVLQVLKILFVTIQLCLFGSDGYTYELQKQHTLTSFRHIFLLDWTPIREVVSYPPSTGTYAVYTKPEFYENVNHIVKMYSNITNLALGLYSYDGPNDNITSMQFCRQEFKTLFEFNSTLTFDNNVHTTCHDILFPNGDPQWKNFSLQEFLGNQNDSIYFDRLINAQLSFSLKTIFLKSLANVKYPDCYRFKIIVEYDNAEHDGQVLVFLNTEISKMICKHIGNLNSDSKWGYILRQILNCFIIFICALSFLLCCRCLLKARLLCRKTNVYIKQKFENELSTGEKLEFVDAWYCMMIFNDLLIISGSVLKACIEQRTVESDQYATCAILLGTGNLLVWAGVLRYLGFFRKYNILILTLKRALPNVLRFMLCCVLLYAGFCFCGWVVLGPYHIKFRSLSTTSECLFAMMNGDDLFATFAITNTNNNLIWWFSRIYLYIFISMFIYVVISLFISVIMDSYETVKDYYQHGSPLTRIQSIISDFPDDSCSSFYQQRRHQQRGLWDKFLMLFKKRHA